LEKIVKSSSKKISLLIGLSVCLHGLSEYVTGDFGCRNIIFAVFPIQR